MMRTAMLALNCVGALAFASMAMAGVAHASEVVVRVDNKHTDNWQNAKSNDNVTVSIKFCQNCSYVSQTRRMDSISNSHDFTFEVGNLDACDVYDVRIAHEPNGQDLFVIDQLLIYDRVGSGLMLVDSWGVDNTKGYCFSYQSSDYNNSHCHPSGVGYWSKTFKLDH